jgi:HEXXH motif-containing protein
MRLEQHRLPAAVFDQLAAGGGGAAIRVLASGHRSRTLLLLRESVRATKAVAHPDAALVDDSYQRLAEVQRYHPAAFAAVADYPTVHAWALQTLRGLAGPRPEQAPAGWLSAVAAAAAVRAGMTTSMPVAALEGSLTLPSLGTVRSPAGLTARLESDATGAVLCHDGRTIALSAGDPDWFGLPQITLTHGGLRLDVLLDPLDGHGWATGGHPLAPAPTQVTEWQGRLAPAWRLLVEDHPVAAREIAAAIHLITPLSQPPVGHVSSTFRDTFGAIAMSAPGEPEQVALTLVHEVQHVKLSGLMALYPLLTDRSERRFQVPWRDDPRPVDAVLHGTYAHLGVTAFWRRQRHLVEGDRASHAHSEYVRWRTGTYKAALLLSTADGLSDLGERFVARMIDRLAPWQNDD